MRERGKAQKLGRLSPMHFGSGGGTFDTIVKDEVSEDGGVIVLGGLTACTADISEK